MKLLTLLIWITTAGGGLFLLSIWLIEYDDSVQRARRSRLSIPLIAAHVLPAGGGLVIWGAYVILGLSWLAWVALAALAVAVPFGLVMATRWIGVYRAKRATRQLVRAERRSSADFAAVLTAEEGPAERHFPLALVLGHGLLAITTVILVVIVALSAASG